MATTPSGEHWRAFDAAWFARHQARLLWWLNGPLRRVARWALRLDDARPIAEIAPHYHRIDLADGQRQAVFRTHAKFSKRVYYALAPLWWCLHFLDWFVLDRLAPAWSFGLDTLTAYPQAGSGGSNTTCDGYIRYYDYPGETWSTMRNATDGTAVSLSSANTYCAEIYNEAAGAWSYFQRGGFTFLTSAIGSGSTITAATFSIRGTGKDSTAITPGDDSLDCVAFTPANAAAFTTADYDQFGTTSFANKTYAAFSTSGYNDFALNASGLAAISKTGTTGLGVRIGADRSNTEPSWDDYDTANYLCYYADNAGTTADPKLVVTYTTGGAAVYKSGFVGYGDMIIV